MTLNKIISGGQTGADQGALAGAAAANFATGGFAPHGWRTVRGEDEELLRGYGLVEHHTAGYAGRTLANVRTADGTLLIGNIYSRGSELARRFCQQQRKPICCVPWNLRGYDGRAGALSPNAPILTIMNWILAHQMQVLNVAGNRESGNPGIYEETKRLVEALCKRIQEDDNTDPDAE